MIEFRAGMYVELSGGYVGVLVPIESGLHVIGQSAYGDYYTILCNPRLKTKESNSKYDIVKVYDLAPDNRYEFFSPGNRKLLWKYEESGVVEITIEEIEERLGYKIKIISKEK